MAKKVWVINLNTNVKYEIEESWFMNNTNDFALTEAPKPKEVPKPPKAKAKVAKKAKVNKKVLNKDKADKE